MLLSLCDIIGIVHLSSLKCFTEWECHHFLPTAQPSKSYFGKIFPAIKPDPPFPHSSIGQNYFLQDSLKPSSYLYSPQEPWIKAGIL